MQNIEIKEINVKLDLKSKEDEVETGFKTLAFCSNRHDELEKLMNIIKENNGSIPVYFKLLYMENVNKLLNEKRYKDSKEVINSNTKEYALNLLAKQREYALNIVIEEMKSFIFVEFNKLYLDDKLGKKL